MIILIPMWSPHLAETEVAYFGKLISYIFVVVDKGRSTRNGSSKHPICLVILSACRSIYLKVEDNKPQNKMHVSIKYQREKMVATSILASSCYQVPPQMRI